MRIAHRKQIQKFTHKTQPSRAHSLDNTRVKRGGPGPPRAWLLRCMGLREFKYVGPTL